MAKRRVDIKIEERPKGNITYGYVRIDGCSYDLTCFLCGRTVPAGTVHECEQGKKEERG